MRHVKPGNGGEPYALHSWRIAALPLLNHFLGRLGLDDLLEKYLPRDARYRVPPPVALGLLLRNLLLGRRPVYALEEWAREFDPTQLGLGSTQSDLLNDDRVGRALDHLFDADRASFLTEVVLRAVKVFEVDVTQLHNDSTTVTFSGEYVGATGSVHRGKESVAVTYGHNKDHRPDLKQLLWILTVSADGAIPVHFRAADGNTTDDATHIETWDSLCRLVGSPEFLYVADSKLCVRETMTHIAARGGRFLTVLPRSRAEDGTFREWMQDHEPEWVEVLRRRHPRRQPAPMDVWKVFDSPVPSAEGYRIVWLFNSLKAQQDQRTRQRRIEKGIRTIEALHRRLEGPRSRIQTRANVARAVERALEQTHAARWLDVSVQETFEDSYRQERRGRPGPKTHYRRTRRKRFALSWRVRTETVDFDARTDGVFPLITNWKEPEAGELLHKYKYQPRLEKRFEQLKTVYAVAPVFLKSITRVEALLMVFFLALLVEALIERELRRAMQAAHITSLPLYPEARACRAPTADRVFEIFAAVQRHELWYEGRKIQSFPPEISALQHQLLQLLGVPQEAYDLASHVR